MNGNKCTLVLFGSTGDLAWRKLYPALFQLHSKGQLEEEFQLFAVGRKFDNRKDFLAYVRQGVETFIKVPFSQGDWETFIDRVHYKAMDFTDPKAFQALKDALQRLDNDGPRLYYLATAARFFAPIVAALQDHGMHQSDHEGAWRRLVIEKPFGRDLETARGLNDRIRQAFQESDIYRIDHYLGKEMTQNMMVLRKTNYVFKTLWHGAHLDHIQITVAEDMGIGTRGRYYDHAGALRDMVQNHLLQVVALATMEVDHGDSEGIRQAKVDVLRALKELNHEDLHKTVVLGQYEGYGQEADVKPGSLTETFVAMKLEVDTPDMAGVPIYLRTGKELARKEAYAVVEFKSTGECDGDRPNVPNRLIIKIQPMEGVEFRFNVKEPGNTNAVREVVMDFCQTCETSYNTPEAYESLLFDAMKGDPARFTSWAEVEASWLFIDQISKHCEDREDWVQDYEKGSWGPQAADELIAQDGRNWWVLT